MKTNRLFLIGWIISLITFPALAQKITVSGIITDAYDGSELVGVSIQIKGTTKGTVSDVHGQYKISTEIGSTMVFSYIGYETIEMKVQNSTNNVQMTEDSHCLEEIMVVGYGTQRKKDITGSISVVSHESKKTGKRKKQTSSYNTAAYAQPAPTPSV